MEVPFIVHSTQEIYDVRAALSAHLEEIAAEPGVVHNPLQTLSLSAPFLASLPMQDRLVRTSLASTLLSKIPSLRSQAQHLVSWIKDSPLGAGVSPLSADALGKRDIVAMAAPLLRRRIRVGVCSHSFSAASTASLFVDTFPEMCSRYLSFHVRAKTMAWPRE
jgi:hypothetical protein